MRTVALLAAAIVASACGSDESDGPDQPVVPKGSAAVADGYHPLFWLSCDAKLDLTANGNLGKDGVTESALEYTITVFSNGDVLASCDGSIGAEESAAETTYYPDVVNLADTAACWISLEYPPFDDKQAGTWEYATENSQPKARYHDAATHPLNGWSYEFAKDDCLVVKASEAGKWKEAALGDLQLD